LQHTFFSSDLNKRLALELLQRVSNPPHMFSELDLDDEGVMKIDIFVFQLRTVFSTGRDECPSKDFFENRSNSTTKKY
jgi:hypothetical protein